MQARRTFLQQLGRACGARFTVACGARPNSDPSASIAWSMRSVLFGCLQMLALLSEFYQMVAAKALLLSRWVLSSEAVFARGAVGEERNGRAGQGVCHGSGQWWAHRHIKTPL